VAYFIVVTDENKFSQDKGLYSSVSNCKLSKYWSHTLTLCQPAISPIKGMKDKRDGIKSSQNSGQQQ
jgi:hypothetical protein